MKVVRLTLIHVYYQIYVISSKKYFILNKIFCEGVAGASIQPSDINNAGFTATAISTAEAASHAEPSLVKLDCQFSVDIVDISKTFCGITSRVIGGSQILSKKHIYQLEAVRF